MPSRTRRVLGRLARHPRVAVYIITGRRVADVRRRVKVPQITYLGLHGWESRNRKRKATETHRITQRLRKRVEARLSGLNGIWVEDKSFSFVVHYRGASAPAKRKAREGLREELTHVLSGFRVLNGKRIWEVLPIEIEGKGAAVRTLLDPVGKGLLPIYLGDDTTDEAAFEAVSRGITARVGRRRRTEARYELRDPDEVCEFLEKLEAEIS